MRWPGKPLRVVLGVLDEHDALLRELRRGGYQPEHVRVSTPGEMEKALRELAGRAL